MKVTLSDVMTRIRFSKAVGEDIKPHPPLGKVVKDVRAATTHLQSLGFIYTDVKADNIMWDAAVNGSPGRWRLIDFSECYAPGTRFSHAVNGTPGWMDPDATVVTVELLETMLLKLEEYVQTGLEPLPSWTTREKRDVNFRRNVARAIAKKEARAKVEAEAKAKAEA